jgi:hypothetical protein
VGNRVFAGVGSKTGVSKLAVGRKLGKVGVGVGRGGKEVIVGVGTGANISSGMKNRARAPKKTRMTKPNKILTIRACDRDTSFSCDHYFPIRFYFKMNYYENPLQCSLI